MKKKNKNERTMCFIFLNLGFGYKQIVELKFIFEIAKQNEKQTKG